MLNKALHKPVMLEEVLSFLNLRDGLVVIDATIGLGGHASHILRKISPHGKLIGIDRDSESLELAKERLKEYSSQCVFVHDNFCNIDKILPSLHITGVDRVILDLGVSSFQLDNLERGFSFTNEGPLDMRMDRTDSVSAFDLVNNLTQKEISSILWHFGQERFSNRISRIIVDQRDQTSINTTTKLAGIVSRAMPHFKGGHRIHPATRTFQAFRIAVNHELESLEIFLSKIDKFLNKEARVGILSFHSLEDRIAKINFRNLAKTERFKLIVKKPLAPQPQEIKDNPRSRSAKFRVLEKIQ
ncbi:MAG: 16S rRNA (cytosine(1402)-N(4))-methyltransferase RsmH [Candidatus Omnitrophica bacterium]|nr:16S rRNA (cytosine(1402)-N(4))-methyltransferase RsmH [Candidatus Omnitrophota bacterium]